MVVIEEIGIGVAVGLTLTSAASAMMRFANRHAWITDRWRETPALGLTVACFAAAQAIGGSGFIACYAGGLLLSPLRAPLKHDLLSGAETIGGVLGLVTWAIFGSAVVSWMIDRITWPAFLYAVLSLSVIRMLPVYLCLRGSSIDTTGKLFIGWFGPRGLASIVFGIIVLDEQLPGNDVLMATIACTIVLSVIARGTTANPLVKRIVANTAGESGETAEP